MNKIYVVEEKLERTLNSNTEVIEHKITEFAYKTLHEAEQYILFYINKSLENDNKNVINIERVEYDTFDHVAKIIDSVKIGNEIHLFTTTIKILELTIA